MVFLTETATQLRWIYTLNITIPASVALSLAVVNELFPKVLHKPVLYALYGVTAVFAVLFLFLDTIVITNVMDWAFFMYGTTIVYAAVCLIARQFVLRRTINAEQIVFLAGMSVFVIAAFMELGYFTAIVPAPTLYVTGIAMLVFALCEAVAVFTAVMKEADKIKEDKQRLAAENIALDSLARMKTEFIANMSHEIKTPLAVISGGVQQAARLYSEEGGANSVVNASLLDAKNEILREVKSEAGKGTEVMFRLPVDFKSCH